jgi:hypothetical protein
MELKPLHTKIEKEIQLNNGTILLENPTGFPRNKCNLYLINQNEEIAWQAEKPDAQSLFSRMRLNEDGETLSTYTTDGYACELNIKTGKLISKTKMQ